LTDWENAVKTITQLMDDRHEAYMAAKASGFDGGSLTAAWREANREYVIARDTNASGYPKKWVAA